VQVQELFCEYLYHFRIRELGEFTESEEVDVVRTIDDLCCAEDAVGDWDTAAEDRRILHVVDPMEGNPY